MVEKNCMELGLLMNEWAIGDDLKGLDQSDVKALLALKLSQKLDPQEHSLPELAVRDISAPTGGLCGLAFLYKALYDTILTESQLTKHSHVSMKKVILNELNMPASMAESETDIYILGLYHDFMCSEFRAKRSVDYLNHSIAIYKPFTNNKQRIKRALIQDDKISFYGNTLIYECGLGRKFHNKEMN